MWEQKEGAPIAAPCFREDFLEEATTHLARAVEWGVWLVEQGILSQAAMTGGTDCKSLIELMPIVPEEKTEDRAGMGIHLRTCFTGIQNYITRRGGGQGPWAL